MTFKSRQPGEVFLETLLEFSLSPSWTSLFFGSEEILLSPGVLIGLVWDGVCRFLIYWVVGLFKSFFDEKPLNVGPHVETTLKVV
jgi:hypothetical protein